MVMRLFCLSVGLAALLIGTASAQPTNECAGVEFDETLELDGETLVLNGLGLYQHRVAIVSVNVFVAALYVPERTDDPGDILSEETDKALVYHWVRQVDRDDVVDAFREHIEDVTGERYEELEPTVDELVEHFRTTEDGYISGYRYTDGELRFIRGDEVATTLEAPDLAHAVFSTVVGPDAVSDQVRTGLLSGECGDS